MVSVLVIAIAEVDWHVFNLLQSFVNHFRGMMQERDLWHNMYHKNVHTLCLAATALGGTHSGSPQLHMNLCFHTRTIVHFSTPHTTSLLVTACEFFSNDVSFAHFLNVVKLHHS